MRALLIALLIGCTGIVKGQLRPFYSTETNKYGYKDHKGELIIAARYDFAWDFTEGMSPMKLKEKYGFVNDRGKVVVPPIYNYAGGFSDGLAVVKAGDKYGFIDTTGKLVVPVVYDRADNFHVDRANVCFKRHWEVMLYPERSK